MILVWLTQEPCFLFRSKVFNKHPTRLDTSNCMEKLY